MEGVGEWTRCLFIWLCGIHMDHVYVAHIAHWFGEGPVKWRWAAQPSLTWALHDTSSAYPRFIHKQWISLYNHHVNIFWCCTYIYIYIYPNLGLYYHVSSVIMCHHHLSVIIICHQLSSFIIIDHHVLSFIILFELSVITICHHLA